MAVDTDKSAKPESATGKRASVAVSAKPAARPRAVKAPTPVATKTARTKAPVSTKTATAVAKKPVARPAVRKSPTPKKVVHEPEPFVAKGNKAEKPAKAKKAKLVRDSFTMPEGDYALIATLKKRCLNSGVAAKKSEILRAAIANLEKLGDASLVAAVRRLEAIKTGRPAKRSK